MNNIKYISDIDVNHIYNLLNIKYISVEKLNICRNANKRPDVINLFKIEFDRVNHPSYST